MKKQQVEVEKTSILAAAGLLMTTGMSLVINQRYILGIACISVGTALYYIREKLKSNRWENIDPF